MGLLFENPMQLFQFCFVNYLWEFTITVKNKQIQDYIQKEYNYLKNEASICWNASVYNFKKECHPMNTHTHIYTFDRGSHFSTNGYGCFFFIYYFLRRLFNLKNTVLYFRLNSQGNPVTAKLQHIILVRLNNIFFR